MTKRIAISLLVIFFLSLHGISQIVNMESQRFHRDTTGWSGSANANFATSNYGEKVFALNASAHVQYQDKKNLYLLLGNYGFLKGASESFIDNGFLHFRYNYKLNSFTRWEAFTQLQQNAITKIDSRFLVGTGPRFKLVKSKQLRLYAATLAMYETEKETGKTERINDWRSSSYLSVTYTPDKRTELSTTTYYQPVILDGKDYRLLNEVNLRIQASSKFSVNLSFSYQYDSRPATGIQNDTYNFTTGLELDL